MAPAPRHLRRRLDRRDGADHRQVERGAGMVERDGAGGVAGDDHQPRPEALDQAAEQRRDPRGDLGLPTWCRRESRRCRRHRRSARSAAAPGSAQAPTARRRRNRRTGGGRRLASRGSVARRPAPLQVARSSRFATTAPMTASFPGAVRTRLSARLDPVRTDADPPGRQGRRPRDRVGQYRRDQRASDRQQGAGRGDLAARHRQGRAGGAGSRSASSAGAGRRPGGGRRRDDRPPLSGLAEVQGRQGRRDLARRAAGAVADGAA